MTGWKAPLIAGLRDVADHWNGLYGVPSIAFVLAQFDERQSREILIWLAKAYVKDLHREKVQKIEQAGLRERWYVAGSPSDTSRPPAQWLATDQGRSVLEQREANRDRIESERFDLTLKTAKRITDIVMDMKAEWRMEWTQELLDSAFGLPDGTRTTWGDATIDQHQQRVAMFERNAQAQLEGATRHVLAIETIEAAGVSTLREAVLR